jgi:photosystem II stability/assembly factor-like uncharacterized protein
MNHLLKSKFLLSLIVLFSYCVNAQKVKIVTSKDSVSFRGLSVVNDKIIWVSGSKGTVGKSIDSGNTWKWYSVNGFEKSDFRDIEAFNESQAIVISVGEPAYILKTLDGGDSWKVVYENKQKGMFLDALEFWNEQSGIVLGDPIDQRFFIARTFDGGNSWKQIPTNNQPKSDSSEACFAASGTNIKKINNKEAVFVSGGLSSHLYIKNRKLKLPILQGTESTGANSIGVKDSKTFIVVGGDFYKKDQTEKNCCITKDAGNSWNYSTNPPNGYRSCVEFLRKNNWITCGLSGVDYSMNNGDTWKSISTESFHTVKKAKKGKSVYLSGNNKIAKLIF